MLGKIDKKVNSNLVLKGKGEPKLNPTGIGVCEQILRELF
jgi:hypothetical protein